MSNPLGDLVNLTMGGLPGMVESGLNLLSEGGGGSGSAGTVDSTSESSAEATSWSNSWGHRDVASQVAQTISQKTHQAAHSVRDRRASVIKEVSQSEHETLSTRVVTNYNHMHALTVQYYQVLQVYRVETRLTRVERVVYIPFKLFDFHDPETVKRYAPLLAGDRAVDAVTRSPSKEQIELVVPQLWPKRPKPGEERVERGPGDDVRTNPVRDGDAHRATIGRRGQDVSGPSWNMARLSRMANILEQPVARSGSRSAFLPGDAALTHASLPHDVGSLSITLKSGEVIHEIGTPIALAEIESVRVEPRAGEQRTGQLDLRVEHGGLEFPLSLTDVGGSSDRSATDVLRFRRIRPADDSTSDLATTLDARRLTYTKRIIRALGPHAIASLLAPYYMTAKAARDGGNGSTSAKRRIPLIQLVDPKPLAFIGNYVAFRFSSSEALDSYEEWQASNGEDSRNLKIGTSVQDLVPMPTGGVFAEAVLGRSNSAEKLDLTRFWNWQDSPIPIVASDIAPLTAGSRATPEDTTPPGFAQPLINITQPSNMPDPSGTAAVLSAVQNGNMFRDMTGLAATIQAGTSAIMATQAGASTAGQQSGAALNTYIQSEVEKMRIAAQLIGNLASTAATAFTGVPTKAGTISGGGGNASSLGAATNYFDKARSASAISSPVTGGGPAFAPSKMPNGTVAGGGNTGVFDGGTLPVDHPLQAATWGSFGKPQGELVQGLVEAAYSPSGGSDTEGQGNQEVDAAPGQDDGAAAEPAAAKDVVTVSGITIDLRSKNDVEIRNFGWAKGDATGTTVLTAVITGAPAGANGRWTSNRPGALRFENPDGLETLVSGILPGRQQAAFELYSAQNLLLVRAVVDVSVPHVLLVTENRTEFETALQNLMLLDDKGPLFGVIEPVVKGLLGDINYRLLINIAGYRNDAVPAWMTTALQGNRCYTLATYRNLDDDPQRAAPEKRAFGEAYNGFGWTMGPSSPNDTIELYPAEFLNSKAKVGPQPVMQAVITMVNQIKSDPSLRATWVEIAGRMLAENLAHELGHAMLGDYPGTTGGHNVPPVPGDIMNVGRGLSGRAGVEMIDPENFPKPGSYVDGGRAAMSEFMPANRARLKKSFPVTL